MKTIEEILLEAIASLIDRVRELEAERLDLIRDWRLARRAAGELREELDRAAAKGKKK
jgi:hypothetical protein